jgi:hypothetical protein
VAPNNYSQLLIMLSNSSQQQDLFNLMGAMYASVLFVGVSNSSSVQPVVSVERHVSYRERAAGMYSTFPYSFAQVHDTHILYLCPSVFSFSVF